MLGVEFAPSFDFNEDIKLLEELLKFLSIDFVVIPDNPAGKALPNSVACAYRIEEELGILCYPAIVGQERTKQHCLSLIYGAKYMGLKGVACVNGGRELSSFEMLQEAKKLDFSILICTPNAIDLKIKSGANLCITQPIFDLRSLPFHHQIKILPTFMPIFSQKTFLHLQKRSIKLGFEVYSQSKDLFKNNISLLQNFLQGDYYLSILNLKNQLPYLKRLYQEVKG